MNTATQQQIRAIQIARRSLPEMDDAIYRDLIREISGGTTDSSTKLTIQQASSLLDVMKKFGFQLKPNKPTPVKDTTIVVSMVTPSQRSLINHLIKEINWQTPNGYARWLKAKMGLDVVATKAQASRVIEGLKGLKEHGHALVQAK